MESVLMMKGKEKKECHYGKFLYFLKQNGLHLNEIFSPWPCEIRFDSAFLPCVPAQALGSAGETLRGMSIH